MRTIWKFELSIGKQPQELLLPRNSKFLHLQLVRERITLWFEVPLVKKEVTLPGVKRFFRVICTGWKVPEPSEYLGTVVTEHGIFVWHVYEVKA